MLLPVSAVYLMLAVDPIFFSKNNLIVPDIWQEWTEMIAERRSISSPVMAVVSLCYLVAMMRSMHQWYLGWADHYPGRGTERLY